MSYQKGLFGRLIDGFIRPFQELKKYRIVLSKANNRGKSAIFASTVIYGGGNFFTKKWDKGFIKLIIFLFAWFYFYTMTYLFILEGSNFEGINFQVYNLILFLIFIYSYVRELAKTIKEVESQNYQESKFIQWIKKQIIYSKINRKENQILWKTSSLSKKIELISGYILMGFYQIKNKAIIKGITLLLIQVAFFVYLANFGIYDIVDFIQLETEYRPSTFNLVYGYVAILVIATFLWIYINNIKNIYTKEKNNNPRFKSIIDDIKDLKDKKLYVTFLTFPILGVLLFTIIPLIFMISIAFTGYSGSNLYFQWTGLENFRNLIFIKNNLYELLYVTNWTLIWAFFATFTNYFGGIFLAMLINRKGLHGKKFWRTIFIITMATPQFVSLLIMNQMFSFDGTVNQFLLNFGLIQENINFWGIEWRARALIIIVNMWVGIPYLMLLTSGILMNIPEDLYEAAVMEGANKWQLFTKVTMPYMLFITTPLLVMGFIGNINNFNVIFLLTGGRPLGVDGLVTAGGTDILITWLYKLTITRQFYNMSAAIGIIIFILSAVISLSIYRRTASYNNESRFS